MVPSPSMAMPMPLSFKALNPVTLPPAPHTLVNGPPPPITLRSVCNSAQQIAPASLPPTTATNPTGRNPLKPPHADNPTAVPAAAIAAAPVDPRYIAMASRIASYYEQRSQAVANYQHQRCQEWANAHHQRSQVMIQAATAVVAWYIRDRIARRRRRKGRSFRRALASRSAVANGGGRVSKVEAVRRWVMNVPLAESGGSLEDGGDKPMAAATAAARTPPADKEEEEFDMDRELPGDKDAKLFNVADNIIKSHLARVDVPMLGVPSFDESESESESESEEEFKDYEDEGEAEGDDEEAEEDDYEEEYEDDETDGDDYEEEYEDEEGGEVDDNLERRVGGSTSNSKDAQLGATIKRSRKRSVS